MATPTTARSSQRRSTRVAQAVFFSVTGVDGNGESFTEQTGTMELSFQGCRYFSRYPVSRDSWLTLEIPNERKNSHPQCPRARVVWVRKSQKLRGLFQVGVEFEAPGNVWGLANLPDDWHTAGSSDPQAAAEREMFEREMKDLLALAGTGTYYELLRTSSESPREQFRHRYYEFVRKFHPDLHMDHPEWMQPLQTLMESVTLAYKTLTDETARAQYDGRLAASGAFTLGGRQTDVQKTADQCLEKARESFRERNLGGAILWARQAVELEPKSAAAHALLARGLSAVVPFRREAIEHFEKALEIDQSNTGARFQFAALYEEMQFPWRARPQYWKILELDPGNAKAQERLRLLDTEPEKNAATKQSFLDRIFRSVPK